jgi:hypothetical protein
MMARADPAIAAAVPLDEWLIGPKSPMLHGFWLATDESSYATGTVFVVDGAAC